MPISQIILARGSGSGGGGGGSYLPWTVEWFQKSNSTQPSTFPRVFGVATYPVQSIGFSLEGIYYGWAGGNAIGTGVSVTHDSWQHWAMVSDGSVLSIYKDGVRVVTGNRTSMVANSSDDFYVGIDSSASNGFKGLITNFRVVKGSAMYSPNLTSFTVPNVPLASTSNTELLLKATDSGSMLLDSSGRNRTPWGSGNIAWSSDSPFPVFSPISAIAAVRDYGSIPHTYFFATANYPDLVYVQPGWFWREASSGNVGQVTQIQTVGENTLISIIPSTTLSEASGSFEQPSSMGGSIETYTAGYGFIGYTAGNQWALDVPNI